ncbi:hypothetical protein Pla8534_46760 [Lignipirellula cremea]|uniref:Secreted protein n=2 Tax=Lignipirellula cremea TaxID=2528010 RepID=A0A518DYE4_9BACT|nr:hypothetical protein Pla8534_46760 [Lignipirellula cremea]
MNGSFMRTSSKGNASFAWMRLRGILWLLLALTCMAGAASAQSLAQQGNGCADFGPAIGGPVDSTPKLDFYGQGMPPSSYPDYTRPTPPWDGGSPIQSPSAGNAPRPPGEEPRDLTGSDPGQAVSDSGLNNAQASIDNSVDNFVRQSGVAAESQSLTPNMTGDMLGTGPSFVSGLSSATLAGTAWRRIKTADNNSPFARDRVFATYHHFHNSAQDALGNLYSTDRYRIGMERRIFDGRSSLELRVPIFSTIGEDQDLMDPSGQAQNLGNISLSFKRQLITRQDFVFSSGVTGLFPTGADDSFNNGVEVVSLKNESIHLLPFLSAYAQLTDNVFLNLFSQIDFDLSGNEFESSSTGYLGSYQDQNLLLLDMQAGAWLYRNPCSRVKGIAGLVELHYNTSLQDTDVVSSTSNIMLLNTANRFDTLNLTGALHFELGRGTTLRVGAATPLRTDDDRAFDAEFFVQVNHYLGARSFGRPY